MKMVKQKKSGISLIVLVITIIVMIILAAAIILSLDGSNIIERAKGAQSSNDVATAKEIVALAKSEWSFERPKGYDTFREYAESKLEEAGYDMDNTYVEDSGRVLFDTAARFAKAGVEIGTEVTGYTLNSTTSYTTSGKENTCDANYWVETDPQPATIVRDTAITWIYVGVDENGNAMLAGSVTSTTPNVRLGEKGGYLNGATELDKICEAMYSTAKGTARNMNIDDVTRILEYTGEEGVYHDQNNNEVKLRKAKTIGQIAKEINYDIADFEDATPESGKKIGAYKSDYFRISKTNDASEYNTERADLIYPSSVNTKLTTTYWLSSSCVCAHFDYDYADFGVLFVNNISVDTSKLFVPGIGVTYADYALRPVVSLSSDIQVTYNGTTAAIN